MIENLQTKVWRHNKKTKVAISFELENESKEQIRSRLDLTKSWLLPYLVEWMDFDFDSTVNLFADSLINLGKGLLIWNNLSHSKCNGRRAIWAGEQLKRAYDFAHHEDLSYINWTKRHTNRWEAHPIGFELVHEYSKSNAMNMKPEIYSEKMFHIIHKRSYKQEKQMKEDAWNYINKHIEKFWD